MLAYFINGDFVFEEIIVVIIVFGEIYFYVFMEVFGFMFGVFNSVVVILAVLGD